MRRNPASFGVGFTLATGLVLLAACGTEEGPSGPDFQVIEEVEFDATLGVDLDRMTKTEAGLYFEDTVEGTGDPAVAGNNVEVEYTGYLTDGSTFDSGTFPFTLGIGQVIAGFDLGVTGMKAGGQRRIIIPPALGYGGASVGSIPAGSILIFDLELLSIG